ncbi:hypothetical protein FBU30_002147 [Linnemannia zychae]|nr:hypothetical protein FBU30_002147 [Linnemannia zychae]
MLDASECFKYYFKVPQIMNVSAQPEWYVATAHISSYQYGRVGVCDRCLKVRTMDSRHQVIAKVIGNCPTCLPDQIELSPKSFYQLGIDRNRTSGWDKIRTLGAVYSFVECPIVMEGTFWPYIPPQVAD